MSHEELCERARRWLRGSRRCDPVFSNIASCAEIPDAIGWSSTWKWRGSTVIECKTSVADFHADKKKRYQWKAPGYEAGSSYLVRDIGVKDAAERGYERIAVPMMGTYRFYLCPSGVISAELVDKYAPDHGLLYVEGRKIRMVKEAPKRELIDKDAEIRYLRFAIINGKQRFEIIEEQPETLFSEAEAK